MDFFFRGPEDEDTAPLGGLPEKTMAFTCMYCRSIIPCTSVLLLVVECMFYNHAQKRLTSDFPVHTVVDFVFPDETSLMKQKTTKARPGTMKQGVYTHT